MTQNFESLSELLEQSVRKFKNNDLFGTKQSDGSWNWLSYADFLQLVLACRTGLNALGVGHGDRVAMVAENRIEWAAVAFASYGFGALFVPMYPTQPAKEWEHIVTDSEAKVVFASSIAHEALTEIAGRVSSCERIIALDAPPSDERSFAALVSLQSRAPVAPYPVKGTDIATLIYTSGTTNYPKGVVLTHRNLCSNVSASSSRFDFRATDRALCFLPWAHAYGQTAELYTFVSVGAAMAINDQIPKLIDNLAVVQPTVLVAVPRVFNRLYACVMQRIEQRQRFIRNLFTSAIASASRRRAGQRLSGYQSFCLALAEKLIFDQARACFGGRLRFAISGSAALSGEVARLIDALGIEVYEGYGLTETSPVVSTNFAGQHKLGSVGKPLPGVSVHIDSESNEELDHGEIIVTGPNVMQGYYNLPEETARVLLPSGAFRTGDLGYLDAEGYLHITGRIKEQYKLDTGKYVAPALLEEYLKASSYILNAMLYGANKPYNVALIVLDLAAVQRWANDRAIELGDPTADARVRALIKREVTQHSAEFKSYERPKKLALITDDFTHENNMLTPSMKLKRRNVLAKYQLMLDALYRDHGSGKPPV